MSRAAKDEPPAVAGARDYREEGTADGADFHSGSLSAQAAQIIEGESYARVYLDRLQRGTVSPDDLAVLMAFLRGEMLAGACRAIEKALGERHA